MWRTFLLLLWVSTLLLTGGAGAAPIVPPTLNWDAANGAAGSWGADGGGPAWTVSGAVHQTGVSALPGIGAAYLFDGVNDAMTSLSFQSLRGNPATTQDVSFELWFRPGSLTGGNQVLFETGGQVDGLSFTLSGSTLLFRVKDGTTGLVSLAFDLSGIGTSEFIQVVATVSLDDTASLYVNGGLVGTVSASGVFDWTGTGGAGLGDVSGRVGGTNGPGEGDLFPYGTFDGEIALFRYYENQVLDAAQVLNNFSAVVTPEPGSALLLGLGLAGLGLRRLRPFA